MLFFCCAESVTTLGSGSLFSHLLGETAHEYGDWYSFGAAHDVIRLAVCPARQVAGQVRPEVSALGDVICLRHPVCVRRDRIVRSARIAIMLGVDERYGHQNTDQTRGGAAGTRTGRRRA